MDRVFLDANVLFSAAYAPANSFLDLWKRKGIRLLTSDYAVEEARRNLREHEHLERLRRLTGAMEIVSSRPEHFASPGRPSEVSLPEKDQPILVAAVAARATHLLTGDKRHFGPWIGKRIRGVLIQSPAQYLERRSKPPKGV